MKVAKKEVKDMTKWEIAVAIIDVWAFIGLFLIALLTGLTLAAKPRERKN